MAVWQPGKVTGRAEPRGVTGSAKVTAVVGCVGREASVDARQPLRQAGDPHARQHELRRRLRVEEGALPDP